MSKTATLPKDAMRLLGIASLATKAGKTVAKIQRSTVATRKEELAKDLENFNVDRLLELAREMDSFVDLVTLSLGEELVLADAAKFTLLSQKLSQRNIAEFLAVVDAKIKALAFAHMDAALEAEGIEDPAAHNAEISVPALGYTLKREGAGYTDPTINEGELLQLLGDDLAEKVFTKKTVTTTSYELDLDKLFAAVEADPKIMEAVSSSLEPGGLKKAKMALKAL